MSASPTAEALLWPVSSGPLLETFSPKGDGTYDETNLGVAATT